MNDRIKASLALAIGIALCAWFGWFHPWDWRAWASLIGGAVLLSTLAWAFEEFDGSNVKW
jgi:hypothetical protein